MSPSWLRKLNYQALSKHSRVRQWLGAEVSDDPRYLNASLAHNPWTRWPENCEGSD